MNKTTETRAGANHMVMTAMLAMRRWRIFTWKLLPLLLCPLPATAQTDIYNCVTNADGTLTITNYTGPTGAVIIPGTINGLVVSRIGDYAFRYKVLSTLTIPDGVTSIGTFAFDSCGLLASVTIGGSVTNIGDQAFNACTSLTNATLGGGVTTIGTGAFSGTGLTTITIPAGVTNIASDAFAECASLFAITMAAPNSMYSSVDGVLFDASQSRLLEWPQGKAGAYTIPGTVTAIGPAVFAYSTLLTGVTIGGSVTNIGDGAFQACINLTNASLGASVTTIGTGAFSGTGLTSITIPDNVKSIGEGAFSSCALLASAKLGSGVTSIGAGAFEYCASLTSLTIPDSVTRIGDYAFSYCTRVASAALGGGVASLGAGVFENCTGLTNLTVPDNVTSLGDYALASCTSLVFITLGNGLTNLGSHAFESCSSLASVTLSKGLTSLPAGTFDTCTHLTAINVDPLNPVYSSVAGVLFNKSATTLIQCPPAKSGAYTVPSGVTSIAYPGFTPCWSLTSVTIPASVTNMAYNAFNGCAGDIYFQGNAPNGGSSFFEHLGTVYYLPGTTGWDTGYLGTRPLPWVLPNPLVLSQGPRFGVQTNGFGFIISWATNGPVVVEASADLAHPVWTPVSTNTLSSGSAFFSDPDWTNHAAGFYRVRSP